jgi:hypothetical protein
MDWKYSFLTARICIRSKHKYKLPLADTPALYFDIHEFNFHVELQPFWIPFRHSLVSFIVTSLPFPSWHIQFITNYKTRRALISKVCIIWTQISAWRMKCLQQWTYTEQNVACLMLTHISSKQFYMQFAQCLYH